MTLPRVTWGGKALVTRRYSGAVSRKKTAKAGLLLEFQLPGLAHEVVTIAVVRLIRNFAKSRALVDVSSRMENAVRPERDHAVTGPPGEADAFVYEPAADAQSTRRRLDIEKTESRDSLRILHTKDRADYFAVALGDPAPLALRIEALKEFCGDFGDEGFELLVPAVLLVVEHALPVNDPADVSGLRRSNDVGHSRSFPLAEERFEGAHGVEELAPLAGGEPFQHGSYRFSLPDLYGSKGAAPLLAQSETGLTPIGGN